MDVDPTPHDQPTVPSVPGAAVNMQDEAPLSSSLPPVSPVIAAELKAEGAQVDQEPQTQPPVGSGVAFAATAKKSHKTALILGGIIIVLILVGVAWYVLYSPSTTTKTIKQTSSSSTSTAVVPATAATNGSTVDGVMTDLSSSAADESTAASTNDTSEATDASTTAGNVGDSINENTF